MSDTLHLFAGIYVDFQIMFVVMPLVFAGLIIFWHGIRSKTLKSSVNCKKCNYRLDGYANNETLACPECRCEMVEDSAVKLSKSVNPVCVLLAVACLGYAGFVLYPEFEVRTPSVQNEIDLNTLDVKQFWLETKTRSKDSLWLYALDEYIAQPGRDAKDIQWLIEKTLDYYKTHREEKDQQISSLRLTNVIEQLYYEDKVGIDSVVKIIELMGKLKVDKGIYNQNYFSPHDIHTVMKVCDDSERNYVFWFDDLVLHGVVEWIKVDGKNVPCHMNWVNKGLRNLYVRLEEVVPPGEHEFEIGVRIDVFKDDESLLHECISYCPVVDGALGSARVSFKQKVKVNLWRCENGAGKGISWDVPNPEKLPFKDLSKD